MTSPPLRCLIVDDEELARTLLQNYADQLPSLQVVGQCSHPIEAMDTMRQQPVDLLFLDIQMPKMTGISLLNTLTVKPLVIFTTAYQQYAMQGYELDVVDYLLKPIAFERFAAAVNKALSRRPPLPPENTPPPAAKDHIIVRSEHRLVRLYLRDILYIEGMREYVAYHTATERILSLYSLQTLEQELPATEFVRIHKSFIVGIRHVRSIESDGLRIGQKLLPIGNTYRDEVRRRVF